MTHVERYHAPLHVSFLKIWASLPRKAESDSDCLQLAVKAFNDTIGLEGLCPTLLVFGSLPRPPRRTPAVTQLERAYALDGAMKAVQKEQAKRRIAFALRHPGGPKRKEQESELEKIPSGAPVLVYREKTKQWEGPFPFVHIDGGTVVAQMPTRRKIFRSTAVKRAPHEAKKADWNCKEKGQMRQNLEIIDNENGHQEIQTEHKDEEDKIYMAFDNHEKYSDKSTNLGPSQFALFGAGENKHMVPSKEHNFVESRKKELEGLRARGVFEVLQKQCIPQGTRIYGTRWFDVVKVVDGTEIEKSRLVAQNFRDKGATTISTKSPTVSRMGQRVTVATASLFPLNISYVRNISQAYLQSESSLERLVFLQPPPEMGFSTMRCYGLKSLSIKVSASDEKPKKGAEEHVHCDE